jgi:hypothetical protein
MSLEARGKGQPLEADVRQTIANLPPGNYIATVNAFGNGSLAQSALGAMCMPPVWRERRKASWANRQIVGRLVNPRRLMPELPAIYRSHELVAVRVTGSCPAAASSKVCSPDDSTGDMTCHGPRA